MEKGRGRAGEGDGMKMATSDDFSEELEEEDLPVSSIAAGAMNDNTTES